MAIVSAHLRKKRHRFAEWFSDAGGGELVLLAIEEFEGPICILMKPERTGTRVNSYLKVLREAGGALTRRPLRKWRTPLEA